MTQAWVGPERRSGDRRQCEWPACGAKFDADQKHTELRQDLSDIKKNQENNGAQFQSLAATMERVASIRESVVRIEAKHDADLRTVLARIETLESAKMSRKEIYAYGAVLVGATTLLQLVVKIAPALMAK